MKFLEKLGEKISSRPWVAIAVVLLITLLASGAIITDGISFDLDEEDMTPQFEEYDAQKLLNDVFVFETQSITLIRGDALSVEAFHAGIEFEKGVMTDPNASKYLIRPDDPSSSFVNPYSIMALAMAPSLGISLDPSDPTAYYDGLNTVIQLLAVDPDLFNETVRGRLEGSPLLSSLFTKDLNSTSMTASGAMIVSVLDKEEVMADGPANILEYESAVIAIADEVNELYGNSVLVQVFAENTIIMGMADVAVDDLSFLFPLAVLIMVAVLMLMYRDFVDMLIGIICLVFAIIWAFGAAVVFNIGTSVISIAVPVLLLGLGIDYALHLVFRYRDERGEGMGTEESCKTSIGSVGEALILATITTVIAFLSNSFSSMKIINDFGLLSAVGIICNFIIMILMIPSVQVIRDRRAKAKGMGDKDIKRFRSRDINHNDVIGRISIAGGKLAVKKPIAVLIVGVLVFSGFAYAASNVSYKFDVFDFLPEDSEEYEMLDVLFNDFNNTGQSTVDVLIYGDPLDPLNPDLIRAMEQSLENIKEIDAIATDGEGNLLGALYLSQTLYNLNESLNDPEYTTLYLDAFNSDGTIKDDATSVHLMSIAEYLYSLGNESVIYDLSKVIGFADDEPLTRMQVRISGNPSDSEILAIREEMRVALKPFEDAGYKAIPTGLLITGAVILDEMENDQMTSLLITLISTLVVLSIAMYFSTRSFVLGALATLPTLFSVVMTWGSMYLLDISLNVMTLTIGSLAVGIGVTYGIHIAHRFSSELSKGHTVEDAILISTGGIGRGVLGAALTTALGFAVLGFSSMIPLVQFGLITAMAIIYAYLGATLLLPALLVIWGKKRVGEKA
ncbi:MAG: uncharacterized protein PWQ62_1095 [Candidatus Methanomethylophilaceae archaeon]|nr:uncharacterized protein [Candidatus Methanomethylophilaceae archaeon]